MTYTDASDAASVSGSPDSPDQGLRLRRWHHPAILATAAAAATAGFAQFGATSALADVAKSFGERSTSASTVAAQVGLSFTVLGIGLGIIRLAALGSLPLAGLADRLGRRRVMLGCTALGLAVTAVAALSRCGAQPHLLVVRGIVRPRSAVACGYRRDQWRNRGRGDPQQR